MLGGICDNLATFEMFVPIFLIDEALLQISLCENELTDKPYIDVARLKDVRRNERPIYHQCGGWWVFYIEAGRQNALTAAYPRTEFRT